MTPVIAATTLSDRPDPRVLDQLAAAGKAALVIATLIAATVLCGWIVPAVGSALPHGWSGMKANTTVAVLLCVASFTLANPKRHPRLFLAGQVCAYVAVLIAGVTLGEYWSGRSYGIDTLLAADSGSLIPGRMSIPTASILVLLGLSLTIEPARRDLLGQALDAMIVAIVAFSLVLLAGFAFGAFALFGQTFTIRTSPQTLVCLVLLTFVLTARRAPYGQFSVLTGIGIGATASPISASPSPAGC